jgi:cellulose synthase/poly-beta-1,6-N-acetylglucosamine synthase-like glycosyltransferase
MVAAAVWLFWATLAISVYTYLGYPSVVGLLARLFGRPHGRAPIEPTVTLLIPAHDEAVVIAAKLDNALALDYPRDKLQIRVLSDGSTDGTDAIVRRYAERGVELQRIDPRGGKPNAINNGVPLARGEILVLCDANTMFARDALRRLVRHFADPAVGAVTGDVRLRGCAAAHGAGEGLLFRIERFLQVNEARLWTAIGVDGGMYALRRSLYVPNRRDTLIDDFVIAMNVAKAGARVIYDPEAVAEEDSTGDPAQELRRRMRTTAGGFQSLFEGLGRPGARRPVLALAYLSHKGLRWLGPATLALMFAANLAAARIAPFYAAALALQLLVYGLAAIGAVHQDQALPRVVGVPYFFCLTNAAAVAGMWRWWRRSQPVTWVQAQRAGAPTDGHAVRYPR